MSYPPAPPRTYQIDVVGQVGAAYRAVFERARLVVEMALLPFIIVLAIELAAALISHGGLAGEIFAGLIRAVAILAFATVFIVRWHRYVLLGETVGGELLPPGWKEFVFVAIKIAALAFAGWIVLILVALLPPFFITIPLTAAGGVALTLVALRVSLIFPAAAIGRPVPLRTAWDWVAGNFWRLFACAFAAYFPFLVVQMLLGALAAKFPSLFWIVFWGLRLAVSFAGAAVVAALLSHLYRELAVDPA
ncbi:MAG TPA: hypothetical protein VG308_17170 [Stellaceae bacterium]|nr:hypothetical protein [Stellaceae bacterium]